MIPSQDSSGRWQRLGALGKQDNALLGFLGCEEARQAVRGDPALKRFHRRKLVQKELAKARIAAARKWEMRLWIMLRGLIDYAEFVRRAADAGMPGPRVVQL
jgi:transposase